MFLIVSSGVSLHKCIEVITSERNERPQSDAHFLIPGLNLSSLETFTMCGRFMIYQFRVAENVFSGQNGIMERVQKILTVWYIVKLRQGSGKERQGMVKGERP